MNSTHISNGEQLRVVILEYSTAMRNKKVRYGTFNVFITTLLAICLSYDLDLEIKLGISFLLLLSFTFAMFHTFGLFAYQNVINILRNTVIYFATDIENKYAIIEFFTPSKTLAQRDDDTKNFIIRIFHTLLPQYSTNPFATHPWTIFADFYAMPPNLHNQVENSIMDELEKIVDSDLDSNNSNLPSDIKSKGKEMSRAYLMLYCIENTLRLFIESEGKKMLQPLVIPNSVRNKIAGRKANESQNKYISVRGASDLFYMDFKELGDVIVNNPELKNRFPDENWVRVKIDELGNVRNLIAHNSYIGEHELKIISTNYESILRQIRK